MEIEINVISKIKKKININLPYYYEHNLSSDRYDSVLYGKICEKETTTIQITNQYLHDVISYEIEIAKCNPAKNDSYFTDEHKSSESEYLAAKAKVQTAINNA